MPNGFGIKRSVCESSPNAVYLRGNVLLLEDPLQLERLARDDVDTLLMRDLVDVTQSPVIIRTDIQRTEDRSAVLLPRTNEIVSPTVAAQFMRDTLLELARGGVPPKDVCFLLHRLIPAVSGVWAFARPMVPRVRIDSLWGSPDGLNYYAHDSFDVDLRSQAIPGKHIRCKSQYIGLNTSGEWSDKRSGWNWDWEPSIADEELMIVANGASKVASHLGKPIAIMYFIGVDPKTSLASCLPWYYTKDSPTVTQEESASLFTGNRVIITSESDLHAFKKQVEGSQQQGKIAIRLRPNPQLLRTSFIEDVAQVAVETRAAIELEGSILSHAYYVLKRHGVRVRCVDPLKELSGRQEFGKLVRDKIPLRIELHGEQPQTFKATQRELLSLLKAKAVEEALELFWASDKAHIVEELADILEVVESTCKLLDVAPSVLRESVEKKRLERGGFDEGLVLVETRAVPLIAREPNDFPEIGRDLFGQTHSVPVGPGASSLRRRIEESRRPRAQGNAVTIPLVPPDPLHRIQRVSVALDDVTVDVQIGYNASTIDIVLIDRPSEARSDARQRRFLFMDDEF